MCRFEYREYKPCGCEVYEPQDARFCVSTNFWPTVVIRRTEQLGDIDFFYQRKRYVTAKKGCKVKFPWLHKEQKYTRYGVFERGARDPCPVPHLFLYLTPTPLFLVTRVFVIYSGKRLTRNHF